MEFVHVGSSLVWIRNWIPKSKRKMIKASGTDIITVAHNIAFPTESIPLFNTISEADRLRMGPMTYTVELADMHNAFTLLTNGATNVSDLPYSRQHPVAINHTFFPYNHPDVPNIVSEDGSEKRECCVCHQPQSLRKMPHHVASHIINKERAEGEEESINLPCGLCGRRDANCGLRLQPLKRSKNGGVRALTDCVYSAQSVIYKPGSGPTKHKPSNNYPMKCPLSTCSVVMWSYNVHEQKNQD